jgi:hypothetical protein
MTQTLTGEFIIHNTKEANLELTFKLSNNTDKTVHVCKYGTPLEGLVGSGHIIFTDVATNQVAKYQGPMARRVAPTVSNGAYTTVPQNGSVVYKQKVRAFTLERGKTYSVTTRDSFTAKNEYLDNSPAFQIGVVTQPCTVTIN